MTRLKLENDQDERIIIEYDDTTHAWNDWKYGNFMEKSFVHERYILSLSECTKIYTRHKNLFENSDRLISSEMINIPSLIKILPEKNINCYLCKKYHNQLYSCRICEKVYHQQCIKNNGNIKSYYLMKNTMKFLNFGWSCPICEDLRILLSPIELAETNEWIKSLNTQTIYNLDYYLNNRMKSKLSMEIYFNQLNNHMKNVFKNFLNTIADMNPNHLSHTDLFTLDICMKIIRTPSIYLVNSLTQYELYRLSQLFIFLSSNNHQYITTENFQQIFNTYLQITIPELNSDEKYLHLEALTYSFLGQFNRTWNQFLLDNTISTLLGRLNHRTPSDFINRIISIKHSTNSSTSNFRKYQSLTIMMKNILQKLQQTTTTT